ncbi:hypothetical protein QUW14_07165 [Bacteroides gallinaceum]|uniref:hypothetical protein n=2 Tax=Bacteroides TaxID=816 RepID=UPI0025A4792B|nr:hypothetical protein [Bacteroides gallinaceum]MDM8154086.1 hypothetical protein [Bacteroides gallinaceum]
MIWDEFLRHFRFCDEEDSGLSDEEQERKGPKNRPKHTRKRIHQVKKNFLEKFKTASNFIGKFKQALTSTKRKSGNFSNDFPSEMSEKQNPRIFSSHNENKRDNRCVILTEPIKNQ